MSEAQQRAEVLARDVLQLARNTLLVNLRFLDAALSQFALTPAPLPFASSPLSPQIFPSPPMASASASLPVMCSCATGRSGRR